MQGRPSRAVEGADLAFSAGSAADTADQATPGGSQFATRADGEPINPWNTMTFTVVRVRARRPVTLPDARRAGPAWAKTARATLHLKSIASAPKPAPASPLAASAEYGDTA
ncbi:MAG: hypothetical protein ABW063_11085 [Caulobacter sp.]